MDEERLIRYKALSEDDEAGLTLEAPIKEGARLAEISNEIWTNLTRAANYNPLLLKKILAILADETVTAIEVTAPRKSRYVRGGVRHSW